MLATDLPAELEKIEREIATQSLSPFFHGQAKRAIQQEVRDNFTSSASPDNADWPPRKREGDGHPLLIDTGALLQAATGGGPGTITEILDREMNYGVSGGVIPYAAIHNNGGETRPMPQREYMGMSEVGEEQLAEELAGYLIEKI
jgi:phage gpG-like protein